jgi:hypothetical protein
MFYVPSVGEDFTLLVRELVHAGIEHFNDDVGLFPWR